MTLPTLDQSVQDKLNNLVHPDYDKSYYFENILDYGIIGIATYVLFKKAQELIPHQMSLEEFVEHYQLKFGLEASPDPQHIYLRNFCGNIIPLKNDGIFIPIIGDYPTFLNGKRNIYYFDADNMNHINFRHINPKICNLSDEDEANAHYLCSEHRWIKEDLINSQLIAKSLQFAKNMWYVSKVIHNLGASETNKKYFPPTTLSLFDKLIDYYQSLMER